MKGIDKIRFYLHEINLVLFFMGAGYAIAIEYTMFFFIYSFLGIIYLCIYVLEVRKYNIVPFFFKLLPKKAQEFWNTIE